MIEGKKIVIIGAGYTGLAAAHDLARAGAEVTVLEKDPDIGGLAGTFELKPGFRVEKFYHHWFASDREILALIEELGLGSSLKRLSSRTGLFYANSSFRLASPLDLLRFSPLPLIDRIRTGIMALRCRRISDFFPLEDISAKEWLIRWGGAKAYSVIWEPLLVGKFGPEAEHVSAVWFWNKIKLRGSSRDSRGAEQLLYFQGGFGALTDGMRSALTAQGVQIRTGVEALEVLHEGQKATGVRTGSGELAADAVLATNPLPEFLSLVPSFPVDYVKRCREIRYLGNVCLVLRLNRSLSDTYWLNVADPSFPFVGIIEHTNFDDPAEYGGEHIAYLSKYLPTSDPMFSMDDGELFRFCLPHLKRIFPDFSESWVLGYHSWRAHYSQPVIVKRYSQLVPPLTTPLKDLWLATMAQIYPEDRGTNYAVRQGRLAARSIIESLSHR